MKVEDELNQLSTVALTQMKLGLELEMQRLSYDDDLQEIRDAEDWPHAVWKGCAILHRAVERILESRAGDGDQRRAYAAAEAPDEHLEMLKGSLADLEGRASKG